MAKRILRDKFDRMLMLFEVAELLRVPVTAVPDIMDRHRIETWPVKRGGQRCVRASDLDRVERPVR